MFIRLHNFLCDVLSWMNPTWDDTILFQESRRLLIAMYQHIVYFEFLPILIGIYLIAIYERMLEYENFVIKNPSLLRLGYDYAIKYDLMPKKNKLQDTYDPAINPNTVNSFATAAFRYFHVLFPSSIRYSSNKQLIALHKMIKNNYR